MTSDVRRALDGATDTFAGLVYAIPDDAWGRPAVGNWDIRGLVGHTCRAFTTAAEYVADAPTIQIPDAVTYYRVALSVPNGDADIEARGNEEGARLGADPAAKVHDLIERSRLFLDDHGDDTTLLHPRAGSIRLGTYLETRVVEVTVHALDLARALGTRVVVPVDALELTLGILGRLGAHREDGAVIAHALAGRIHLPPGTSVL